MEGRNIDISRLHGLLQNQMDKNEVSAELNDSKHFTVVDTKSGYWMVEFDSESSLFNNLQYTFGENTSGSDFLLT